MDVTTLISNYIETHGWLMFISQLIMTPSGIISIYLTQSESYTLRKWASMVAMVGQPFWYILAWVTEAWGLFFMNFFFTFSWLKGIWIYWIKPNFKQPTRGN